MFEYRCGIKLKSTVADAAVLKLLRKHFPNTSLGELRSRIQAHDYVYLSDMLRQDGEREAVKMLREFDRAGIETELFEESRDAPGPWNTRPLDRDVLYNMLQRSRGIQRQVLEDIERETTGYISPEARAYIDEEMSKEEETDRKIME